MEAASTDNSPDRLAEALEQSAALPPGPGERFSGYGVMGLPFRSAHVLAMRRFSASSVGPAYTSVWHRDPRGDWSFYTTAPPEQACPRYFGEAAAAAVRTEIRLAWRGPFHLQVAMPALSFLWDMHLGVSAATRFMTTAGRLLPQKAWRSPAVLGAMGRVAGPLLGVGRVGLRGRVPNGQRFIANPLMVWTIRETSARMQGKDFGPPGPLTSQSRLEDFWIPQRGLFAIGRAFFDPFDPAVHSSRTSRGTGAGT